MWKIVEVWVPGASTEYSNIAGVREDGEWLILRQGSFPDERIIKLKLEDITSYDVCFDSGDTDFRSWDYDEGDE
jgi:hypothetical protein